MEKMLNDLARINGAAVTIAKYDFDSRWHAFLRIETSDFKAELKEINGELFHAIASLHARAREYFTKGMREFSMNLIEGPSAE